MQNKRLDLFLVEAGLIESRQLAQRMIMAGEIRVNGRVVDKPSYNMHADDKVVINPLPRFVSRGGDKLEKALISFGLMDLSGKLCADVGSSTGGFTDCLLEHNARRVYAIDVGKGLLHWKLRNDPRVVIMEQTNARYLSNLPEKVHLVTMDASFISLKILLPVVWNWQDYGSGVIALIKPQFEAGRKLSAKGKGVIRDRAVHQEILVDMINFSINLGYKPLRLIASPILGPKGNKEFLIYLNKLPPGNENQAEILKSLVFNNPDL